ncbi:MAG TPA: 50S ribosomal protein L22 [bacterium]|jgi:large subunit ribosomal protein L22|nr:50S ribosomal protein L22 [bacterium]HQK41401.1 50S ribosomal protein L22 [bacterium]
MKIMNDVNVTAKYMNARVSPKKVAIVLDMIRGKDLEEAKKILAFDRSKPGKLVLKVLKSAEANILNNKKMEKDRLFVSKIWVSGGSMQKRIKAGAKGRADPILKRYSHIYVSLEERVSK